MPIRPLTLTCVYSLANSKQPPAVPLTKTMFHIANRSSNEYVSNFKLLVNQLENQDSPDTKRWLRLCFLRGLTGPPHSTLLTACLTATLLQYLLMLTSPSSKFAVQSIKSQQTRLPVPTASRIESSRTHYLSSSNTFKC